MAIYLIDKFASVLAKEDVIYLFEILKESFSSLKKAAELCGIERKTIYDWNEVYEIKLTTKKKVLNTVIQVQPERTLKFLLKRFEENTAEILFMYINLLHKSAISEESDKKEFTKIFKRFIEIKREYSDLIYKNIEEEVRDISQIFRKMAKGLDVPIPLPSLDELRPTDIVEIISDFTGEILSEDYSEIDDFTIAKEFNIPAKLVDVIRSIPYSTEVSIIRKQTQIPSNSTITVSGIWTSGTYDLTESGQLYVYANDTNSESGQLYVYANDTYGVDGAINSFTLWNWDGGNERPHELHPDFNVTSMIEGDKRLQVSAAYSGRGT